MSSNSVAQSFFSIDPPTNGYNHNDYIVYFDLATLIDQDIQINLRDRTFVIKGILRSIHDKYLSIETSIGFNKNGKEIKDNMIVMMQNISHISKNPVNMETEDGKVKDNQYETVQEKYNK